MTTEITPQPFDAFLESVASATYDEFRRLPGARVESAAAFAEMQAYLLDVYKGVGVADSYVEDGGLIVDCVAEDQHPAARRWSDDPAEPPEPPPAPEPYETSGRDEFVSAAPRMRTAEPPGTAALYRTTLHQLARFPTLSAFSAKDTLAAPAASFPKRYATGEQDIDCNGGASFVNVWRPFATPSLQSTFSQQWYLAIGDGTLLQTVECGWHIDYARYNDSEPHVFVYTTRQNYDDGHSFFNTDGGVFRPVANPSVRPGAKLLVSQTDGAQVDYKMGFFRNNDGWWFYFNDSPIGYYPLAWFNNGPLTTRATRAKFGGEVGSGFSQWPPMGSGQYAAAGYRKAAYQRAAFVHSVAGGPVWATLSEAGSVTGSCYTIDITNNSASSDWATYLFFGGPGGAGC